MTSNAQQRQATNTVFHHLKYPTRSEPPAPPPTNARATDAQTLDRRCLNSPACLLEYRPSASSSAGVLSGDGELQHRYPAHGR